MYKYSFGHAGLSMHIKMLVRSGISYQDRWWLWRNGNNHARQLAQISGAKIAAAVDIIPGGPKKQMCRLQSFLLINGKP